LHKKKANKNMKRSLTDKPEPGLDYHQQPGISSTMLKDWGKMSPAAWYELHVLRNVPKASTAALEFGNLVHTMLLEPFEAGERYKQLPEGHSGATKAGKTLIAECKEAGLTPVKHADWQLAEDMVAAVLSHALVKKWRLFDGGTAESEWYATHSTGLTLRAKPDWMNGSLITDLKTTADAAPKAFSRDAVKYGYHRSEHFYTTVMNLNGITVSNFIFVAVSKTAPLQVSVSVFDTPALDEAARRNEAALLEIAACLDADHWPGHNNLNTISIPSWI